MSVLDGNLALVDKRAFDAALRNQGEPVGSSLNKLTDVMRGSNASMNFRMQDTLCNVEKPMGWCRPSPVTQG
jgi:hypothetical protein